MVGAEEAGQTEEAEQEEKDLAEVMDQAGEPGQTEEAEQKEKDLAEVMDQAGEPGQTEEAEQEEKDLAGVGVEVSLIARLAAICSLQYQLSSPRRKL